MVAVAAKERGGEGDGTHKQMNNSNHNATTLLSLLRCCLLPIKVTSASAASAIAIYGLDLCISATGSLMRTHRRTKQTLNTHTHTCTHSYSGAEYIEFICNLFHFLGLRHAANVQARNERVNREDEEEEARCKAMPLVYAHVCVCECVCEYLLQSVAKYRH